MKKDCNIFLICGDDEFTVKNKCRAIISELCGPNFEENPALSIIHGDSNEKASPLKLFAQILEAILTPPFLSNYKIVWMKNFDFDKISVKSQKQSFDKIPKTKKQKSESEILEDLVDELIKLISKEQLSENVKLVISAFNLDKRSSLYKAIAKSDKSQIFEFEKTSPEAKNSQQHLYEFIANTAAELNISISQNAADLLIEASGANYARIINELEKIAAYIYPRTQVEINDCLQILSSTPEMASWAFIDAITRRNLHDAIKALDILLTPKNPELAILASICNLFSDISQIKIFISEISAEKCSNYYEFHKKLNNCPQEIKDKYAWTKVPSMNPYRIFKIYEQTAMLENKDLANAFNIILEANKQLVSGTENPTLCLEILATKLCFLNKQV